MQVADLPANEPERLASLRRLEILDTLPEKAFDQIVQIAAQVCEAPIAMVTLIDERRQWFKARVGMPYGEGPRELSLCAHAILGQEVFVVEDASEDARFSDNPLVTGQAGIRFYAGAPLCAPDGFPVGTVCVMDVRARPLTSAQRQALQSLSEQVTRLFDLKAQVERLRLSQQELTYRSTAIESIAEGIVLQDAAGAIIDFNPAALRLLGMSADELTGKTSMDPAWQAVHEDGSPFPGQEHPAMVALASGQPQRHIVMGIRVGGSDPRWLNINAVPLFLHAGASASHVVASFADISDLKHLERKRLGLESQLAETARLSALGEMAAGIAHEINNPLSIIRGRAGLLRRRLSEAPVAVEAALRELLSIERTVDRMARIVRGLRAYARKADQDPFQEVALEGIIEDALELCREKFRLEGIALSLEPEGTAMLACRPAQVLQVMTNLLNNAYDAVRGQPAPWIRVETRAEADQVWVSVLDSGPGIDPRDVPHLMEPFFTTKSVGMGTGLGLSISAGIAREHGGTLRYAPRQDVTCFVLQLPCTRLADDPAAAGSALP